MGIIAFAIAPVMTAVSSVSLPSVSFSYFTEAHDLFVGMLFVVAAFLWAYNGHTRNQARASKGASAAAIFVALCPTSCANCDADLMSVIHVVAAICLFAILAYFCFGPFRQKTKGQPGKRGRRSRIYFACGSIMVISMLVGLIAQFTLTSDLMDAWRVTYWVEAIALTAFGVAWIVAGKSLSIIVDDDQKLYLFGR